MNRGQQISNVLYDLANDDLDDLLAQFPVTLRSHSHRVAICSSIMAEYADEFLRHSYDIPIGMRLAPIVHLGGTCHDIGKLLLPALLKQKDDYIQHPIIGAKLLGEHKDNVFDNEMQAQIAMDMIRFHHERPDGNGFPDGLKTAQIPVPVGICALANWLDHRLPLGQDSWGEIDTIVNEVRARAGVFFTEASIVCFERAWPRLLIQYAKWDVQASIDKFEPSVT